MLQDLFNAALADLQHQRFADAEKKLQRLLRKKMSPAESASVYSLLGATYGSWGRHGVAVKSLQKAADLAPADQNILINLCISLTRTGAPDRAIDVGRRAVEANPENEEAHYNLALALKNSGALTEAADAYNDALRVRHDFSTAHNGLGGVFMEKGDLDAAIACFKRAVEARPDYAIALNNLGLASREAGNPDAAIEYFRTSLQKNPKAYLTYNNLGHVYRDRMDWDLALENYRKALELNHSFLEAQDNIGHVLRHQGNYLAAIEAYELADLPLSRAEILGCYYGLGDIDALQRYEQENRERDKHNLSMAAMCDFAFTQHSRDNPHPFCPQPLRFVRISTADKYVDDVDALANVAIAEICNLPSVWEPLGATTQNGFQTRANLFRMAGPQTGKIEEIFRAEIEAYRDEYAGSETLLIEDWPTKFTLNAHAVRLQTGGHQSAHFHASGWVSGVFYLKLVDSDDPDEGAILFGPDGYDHPKVKDEVPSLLHQPTRGDIVIFPSSLFHQTIPIRNDGERIIIAFDLVPEG